MPASLAAVAAIATEPVDEASELRRVRLKPTPRRTQVLAAIRALGARRFTADEVFRRLVEKGSQLAFATVYRNLARLEDAGLLTRHVLRGGKAAFELRGPARRSHLLCLECGRADDLHEAALDSLRADVAGAHGYELAGAPLSIAALCPDCAALGKGAGRLSPRALDAGTRPGSNAA